MGNDAPTRRVMAPAMAPTGADLPDDGEWFYLSWPGWELFLTRHWPDLAGAARPPAARPLLLPDLVSPEADYRALADLVSRVSSGNGRFLLWPEDREEQPDVLARALRAYARAPSEDRKPAGLLDDRLFLALWNWGAAQARRAEELLAETRAREHRMWQALRGDEELSAEPAATAPAPRPTLPAARIMAAWRRLAAPLLRAGDQVVVNDL